jgi:dihydrofolate synthase/folylpolyglutamate synthase
MATVLAATACLQKAGIMDNQTASRMDEAFTHVCRATDLMARWQTVGTHPTVVCDAGHNPAAWNYLQQQLAKVECQQLRIVFGMAADKDIRQVMSMLPKKATYYYTKATTKRACPEDRLMEIGRQLGLKGTCHPTVGEAFRTAHSEASADDFIFVGGSFYVVSDFLKTGI